MANPEYAAGGQQTNTREQASVEKVLFSSEGDETLSQVRYFLHGSASLLDAQGIAAEGLHCREGRATLSTDLAHSLSWAVGENQQYSDSTTARGEYEEGRVFIFKKPDELKVDYALFTNAVVSKDRVTGFPLKYASGRKQLGLYQPENTQAQLKKLKKEERAIVTLSPDCIAAVIKPTAEIRALATDVVEHAKQFEKVDVEKYAAQLAELLHTDPANTLNEDVAAMSRDIITTTIESATISKIRNLALDVLASNGRTIIENHEPQTREQGADATRQAVLTLYEQCHRDGFDTGIPWLNTLIIRESERLLNELNTE